MTKEKHYDTAIIGGGPAGLSAALWCADLGLKTILFEKKKELGGQLLWTFNQIENYLGLKVENGRELSKKFLASVESADIERYTDADVCRIDLERRMISVADKTSTAKTIILATGIRRRKLGIPGEEEFVGRGILESGAAAAKDNLTGKNVVVVGGGDAALENALILSETWESVAIVHRGNEFRARPDFQKKVDASPNIYRIPNSRLVAIRGRDRVESVEIETRGETATPLANAVLIRIGVEPNSELVKDQIDLDKAGYIIVDRECRTSASDVFAIGDVASPTSPTIATAVGMGATAAKVASQSARFT